MHYCSFITAQELAPGMSIAGCAAREAISQERVPPAEGLARPTTAWTMFWAPVGGFGTYGPAEPAWGLEARLQTDLTWDNLLSLLCSKKPEQQL